MCTDTFYCTAYAFKMSIANRILAFQGAVGAFLVNRIGSLHVQ